MITKISKSPNGKKKYIDYISLKEKIKLYLADMINEGVNELSPIEKIDIISKYTKEFTEELDKQIRKVYIFFQKMKNIYIKI